MEKKYQRVQYILGFTTTRFRGSAALVTYTFCNLFVNPFLLCPDNTLQCRPNPCQNTYEPEILHVNRFSSKLVHRYIIYSLTPFFCVLTIHYNADQIHVKTPMNRFSSKLVHRYIIYSLTLLLRGEATHLP